MQLSKLKSIFKKNKLLHCKLGVTLKLKTNINYSVYESGCPLLSASLFTLKFFMVLKSRVSRKSQTLA